MTSNLTRCLFRSKISEYQCFYVCYPETSSCASKPLLLLCKIVIPQCLCQVSLGLTEIQMVAMSSNLTRCLFLLVKPMNINVFGSATPNLALVPANRSYCDVK